MQGDGVSGDFFQTDASDAGCLCAEIASQQFLADPYGFKNLCAPVGTDGRNAHLAHNLEQALADGLDIVLLGRFVIHLHIAFPHQFIQYGEGHVGIDGTGAISQQQGGVHHLANLAAFYNQCGLHAFLNGDEVMMDSANRQQRRDGGMGVVHKTVAQNDIVHSVRNGLLGLFAQVVQGLLQSGFSLAHLEYDREFHGIESFIPDVAEDVQLGVVQHGMGQAYHFAMAFAGHQYIHSHGPDVLGERHD